MPYPKPLSEKSLAKMYREANIDEKKSELLHRVFQAAANLYGVVILRDLWNICKDNAERYGMTDIKRKDLIAFSSIARREKLPYYVYEIDELYPEEKRADLDREIVHGSLITRGLTKNRLYYVVAEMQDDKPYYVPDVLTFYADPAMTPEQRKLLKFLKRLKVTEKEGSAPMGKKLVCGHVGETLGSFSYRNDLEEYEYLCYSGELENHAAKNEKALQELFERTGCSEAEKILRNYMRECSIGNFSPSQSMRHVFDEMAEIGVVLSENEEGELVELLTLVNNTSHLWCNRGWAPSEMVKAHKSDAPRTISLGPEIMAAAERGELDLEEIEEQLREKGFVLEK